MIETKKVYFFGDERYPIDLKAFGWETTESKVEYSPDGLIIPYCILARNKEMDYYEEAKTYSNKDEA